MEKLRQTFGIGSSSREVDSTARPDQSNTSGTSRKPGGLLREMVDDTISKYTKASALKEELENLDKVKRLYQEVWGMGLYAKKKDSKIISDLEGQFNEQLSTFQKLKKEKANIITIRGQKKALLETAKSLFQAYGKDL
ncbi:MAG TPA: hypothetical protein VN207_05065 [Ktedonobacteraceae bacterium]|nr:hypothetical protein [Ktedonobacteraceae bacterium]